MATIYRARDNQLERDVAVKVLRPEYGTDPDFIDRFRHEAQSAASLNHPGVVAVYDYGTDPVGPFIVMELVEGEDLASIIRRSGALPPRAAARLVAQAARALAAAHDRGFVHRDVKPGNILVTREGRVKVADFGIARALSESALTLPGTTLGSVHYFSPEQARGELASPASDIYSLGIVLFELLTGRRPWTGDTAAAIATARLTGAVPEPIRGPRRDPADARGHHAARRSPRTPRIASRPPPRWPRRSRRSSARSARAPARRRRRRRGWRGGRGGRRSRGAAAGAAAARGRGRSRRRGGRRRWRSPAHRPSPPASPGPTRMPASTIPGTPTQAHRTGRRAAPPPTRAAPLRTTRTTMTARGSRARGCGCRRSSPSGSWRSPHSCSCASSGSPGESAAPQVAVPNFVGMTFEEAQPGRGGRRPRWSSRRRSCRPLPRSGRSRSQDPAAGTFVDTGSTVELTIATGPETTIVPDLRLKTETEAINLIVAAGLTLGTKSEEFDEIVPEGSVVSQRPGSGPGRRPRAARSTSSSRWGPSPRRSRRRRPRRRRPRPRRHRRRPRSHPT